METSEAKEPNFPIVISTLRSSKSSYQSVHRKLFVSGLEGTELYLVVPYKTAEILGHVLINISLNKPTLSEDGKM